MKRWGWFLILPCAVRLSAQPADTAYVEHAVYKYLVHDKRSWKKGNGAVTYYSAAGVIKMTAQYRHRKLEGERIQYYDNGQAMIVEPYHKGRLNGVVRSYWPNGNIEWSKPYRKGKLHGARMLLDSTGVPVTGDHVQVLEWGRWQISSHCVDGLPQGKVTGRVDGRISYVGNYVDGMPDGDFIYYNATGTPHWKDVYREGRFTKGEMLNP